VKGNTNGPLATRLLGADDEDSVQSLLDQPSYQAPGPTTADSNSAAHLRLLDPPSVSWHRLAQVSDLYFTLLQCVIFFALTIISKLFQTYDWGY